ncbi:hypothetical protein KB575_00510 [Streptococcus canis]|uniref:hypothetical protein n=1 Tax=Streptococcus canis TaxID=1329 RepID=UPI002949CB32|nr:hypothetical protein [Streptococcus canis]MDV5987550.1 hypothetical protein [Streptococcus canis]
MEILNLTGTIDFDSQDYIIGSWDFDSYSLEALKKLLELEDDNDVIDWFLEHYEEEDKIVKVRKFYNQTISRTDLEVNYYSRLVAFYNSTKIIFEIGECHAEMYDNKEAIEYFEDMFDERVFELIDEIVDNINSTDYEFLVSLGIELLTILKKTDKLLFNEDDIDFLTNEAKSFIENVGFILESEKKLYEIGCSLKSIEK